MPGSGRQRGQSGLPLAAPQWGPHGALGLPARMRAAGSLELKGLKSLGVKDLIRLYTYFVYIYIYFCRWEIAGF